MSYNKEYYDNNRERIIARARKWQLDHPVEYKERLAKCWEENGEQYAEKQREYKKKNREKWNLYQKSYAKKKREEKKKLKEDKENGV